MIRFYRKQIIKRIIEIDKQLHTSLIIFYLIDEINSFHHVLFQQNLECAPWYGESYHKILYIH
jgi:hypothetical protein